MNLTVRRIKAAGYCTYFWCALALGFKKHVYRTSNAWCSGENALGNGTTYYAKSDAAWYATQQLYKHHGYHQCPSCHWATEQPDEHVNVPDSYCAVEDQKAKGTFIEPDADEDMLHSNYVVDTYVQPTPEQVLADERRRSAHRDATLMEGLDHELRMNLEQCPGCGEVMDCSELEMHEMMGCAAAKAMYA